MPKAGQLAIFAAPVIVAAAWVLGAIQPGRPVPDRIGTVNLWPAAASSAEIARPAKSNFPIDFNDQAEVLVTGLDDARGLACDGRHVYTAEENGSIVQYPGNPITRPVPSEDETQAVDLRGLALASGALLIADHGRGAVLIRPSPPAASGERQIAAGKLSGPSGIAIAADNSLFLSDDSPWPSPGREPALETADYARWLDKGTPRPFGVVWRCLLTGFAPLHYDWTPIPIRLRHPSGIAAEGRNGPIYVAESDATEVRWPVIEFYPHSGKEGEWVQSRVLGAVPVEGRKLAKFLGVAVSPNGRFIFAAGPKGLYVFSRTAMLGQMFFDDPVSGVAACGDTLFLVVGHRLCQIRLHGAN